MFKTGCASSHHCFLEKKSQQSDREKLDEITILTSKIALFFGSFPIICKWSKVSSVRALVMALERYLFMTD